MPVRAQIKERDTLRGHVAGVGSANSENINTYDTTAVASDIRKGDTAISKGKRITGSLEEVSSIDCEELTPDELDDTIYLEGTQETEAIIRSGAKVRVSTSKGSFGDALASDVTKDKYFTSAAGLRIRGTKVEGETTPPSYQTKTAIPGRTQQTIIPDESYDALSSVTVKGDANLISSNIKSGITIFGIAGSHEGGGGEGSGGVDASVDVNNLHAWRKYGGVSGVTETNVTNVTLSNRSKLGTNHSYQNADYADSYTISNGEISLVSPTTIEVSSQNAVRTLIGKYIHSYYTGKYYYIPSTAEPFTTSGTYNTLFGVTEAVELAYIDADDFVENVYSEDANEYPADGEQGGARYVYLGLVSELIDGEVASGGTDTSDANAVAMDIIQGATAYVKGVRITGKRPIENISRSGLTPTLSGTSVKLSASVGSQVALDSTNTVSLSSELSNFGDAVTSDVVKGKTFTSSNGLKLTGTHVCEGGITPTGTLKITSNGIHDVTSYASAEVNVPVSGVDTSDATATASDIRKGDTAYVNGKKVTGTLPESSEVIGFFQTPMSDGGSVKLSMTTIEEQILKKNATVSMSASYGEFGDAAASDVAKGKTFTSAAGLKIIGEREDESTASTHVWNKKQSDGNAFSLGDPSSAAIASWGTTSTGSSVTAYMADSVQVADGVISLVDPTTVKLYWTTSNSYSEATYNSLLGKYVEDYHNNFYYIPATSSFTTMSSQYGHSVVFNDVQEILVAEGGDVVGYVTSSDRNAYPDNSVQGSYHYVYVGEFGDADLGNVTPADVAAGKVFSSQNGIGLIGTKEGSSPTLQDKTITANGTYTADSGYDGLGSVKVEVPSDGITLPTLDDPGSESDLAEGKQLIGQDGTIVEGSVPVETSLTVYSSAGKAQYYSSDTSPWIACSGSISGTKMLKNGSIQVNVSGSKFGDATVEDVAEGVTFTSQNGLMLTGTRTNNAGATLPTLTNPGTSTDLAKGKELISADGSVVSGTLQEFGNSSLEATSVSKTTTGGAEYLEMSYQNGSDKIIRSGVKIGVRTALENLGTATAADVAAGKTFTSASGLKITGTGSIGGGGSGATVATATTTPTANSLTISFEGLSAEPTLFSITPTANITLATTRYVTGVDYDGSKTTGVCGYTSGSVMSASGTAAYSESDFTWSYSDGTLTVTSSSATTGGYFKSGTAYQLTYITSSITSGGSGNTGGTSVKSASGTVQITESCESFNINVGFSNIDCIVVSAGAVPSSTSGTWSWVDGSVTGITCYFSYGQYLSYRYGYKSSSITNNGDGTVTVNAYSASYPILSGTYTWTAYGS